jgi:thioredoxin-related protein
MSLLFFTKQIRKVRLKPSLFVFALVLIPPVLAESDLHALILQPTSAMLQAALAGGANPEQRNAAGEPVLMAAVRAQRTDAVKLLLAAGADPNSTNRLGESSLHLAIMGDASILKTLLDADANVNIRDAGGVTPLMLASGKGRETSIDALIAANARLDLKDYQGSSAADWAMRGGYGKLAARLNSALSKLVTPEATHTSGVEFAEDVFVDVKFPDWFKTSFLDLRDDLDEALAEGKRGIMLFISASRCSYCKAFMDTSLSDLNIKKRLTESFDVIGLDIFDDSVLTSQDGEQFRVKEYVTLQKASYTPTLIFLGEGSRPLLRIVGYYPPNRFLQVLDYLDSEAYKYQTLRDYIQSLSQASAVNRRPIINDELFEKPPYMLDRSMIAADRPLLVVFEQPGCTACERFHQRVLQDKAVRRLIGEYNAVQLDAGDEEGRIITPEGDKTSPSAWYRRLELSYTPAILFFDNHGKEVMRLDSETLRYRMEGSLQLVLERAYEQDAQLQRWRRAKAIESIQLRKGL